MKKSIYLKIFLALACGFALMAFACCKDKNSQSSDIDTSGTTQQEQGDVTMYITTGNRTYDFKKVATDFSSKS
ncbi:MAG: hypothetical protein LBC40_07020, partial [Dysgonamonadaceae bacterium]|nr:hypothetical protein [Dysgonamonadaceae bacterium]